MRETTHILDFQDNGEQSFTIEYLEGFLRKAKELGATHIWISARDGDYSIWSERDATPDEIEHWKQERAEWRKNHPEAYTLKVQYHQRYSPDTKPPTP